MDPDNPTSGRVAARLYLPRNGDDWLFEGVYEELEGPLSAENKVQEFTSTVDENGNLTPSAAGIRFIGTIDLDGRCEAEGVWEFFGDSNGSWAAAP
jgi:hypothetical protein